MSEFSKLIDEMNRAEGRRASASNFITNARPRPSAHPIPALRTRPDRDFAKALDMGLAQIEARQGKEAISMAQATNEDRLQDIRARARQAIERATAEIRELIAVCGITAQEVGERQVLLNAFAARMGL